MFRGHHQFMHLGQVAVPHAEDIDAKKNAKRETKRELSKAVAQSHEPLATATTVVPFTLFPDTVIVDRTKITIINRVFFMVSNNVSIRLEDILNVTSSLGPFFGSIQIHTRFFDPGKPYTVNFLWRKDAQRIDRILQGYGIAKEEGIDINVLDSNSLAKLFDELGKGTEGSKNT